MEIIQPGKVGKLDNRIFSALKLDIPENTTVFIGQTNIDHIKTKHLSDLQKYGDQITSIIENPDYVGINKKDSSIECVKEFMFNGDYVKVAVRLSSSGLWFARSIYVLNTRRVNNFIKNGTLIPLTF